MPGSGTPSAWVEQWLGPPGRHERLLDLACGAGRHARLAAQRGFRVLAVDRDPRAVEALADCRTVETRTEDLESGRWSFAAERFAVVVVTHYLFRPRLDLLAGLVAPGGRLIVETFAVGQAAYGKPTRPDFLLRPGELLRLADRAGLAVLAYQDAVFQPPAAAEPAAGRTADDAAVASRRRLQRIVAVRPPVDRERMPIVG